MLAEDILSRCATLGGLDQSPADSLVAHGAGRDVRAIMASVGATTGDLMLAKSLGCDAYLLHHPLGPNAHARDDLAIGRLIDLIAEHGVPRSAAEHAARAHRRRLRMTTPPTERELLVSAAEQLDLTLITVGLPADELARRAIINAIAPLGPESSLGDLAAALRAIPELAAAGDVLLVPDRPEEDAGRVAVMIGSGVPVDAHVAVTLFEESCHRSHEPVRTIVDVSFTPDDARRIESRAGSGATGSVVLIGPLGADAIGMGRLADDLAAAGLDIRRHGALRRVSGPFAPLPGALGGAPGDGPLGLPSTPP